MGTSGSRSRPDEPDARTRLREAALDRIGRCGLHATSTREIIADAGLRNPSAITYYFGSKAQLVDELVAEVNGKQSRIIQQQVELVAREPHPTPEAWAGIAIDATGELLATERGCLLIRIWAAHDERNPDAVERFLASNHDLARSWRAAVVATFPEIPQMVAIARNVIVLRTMQWLTVRRAGRVLDGSPAPWPDNPVATRPFLLELALNILTPPTTVGDPPWGAA